MTLTRERYAEIYGFLNATSDDYEGLIVHALTGEYMGNEGDDPNDDEATPNRWIAHHAQTIIRELLAEIARLQPLATKMQSPDAE